MEGRMAREQQQRGTVFPEVGRNNLGGDAHDGVVGGRSAVRQDGRPRDRVENIWD